MDIAEKCAKTVFFILAESNRFAPNKTEDVMIHTKKENRLYFSIIGKNRMTGLTTLSVRKEEDVMALLQTDTRSQRMLKLRERLHTLKADAPALREKEAQLPAICTGCHLMRRYGLIVTKRYNGIVTLTITGCAGDTDKLKETLRVLPQTRAVITGYDGHSLIVLLRFLLPDGTLPTEAEEIKRFHACASLIARHYVRPYLPGHIELSADKVPETSFLHTLDEDLYYNPAAEPVYIDHSLQTYPTAPLYKGTKARNHMIVLHEFMQRNYETRYNVMTGMVEQRPTNNPGQGFMPLDERAQNSITMDALEEGLDIWDRDIRRYIRSNRIPEYNPVDDFLGNTGKWDGQERIKQLSDCVRCDNPHWPLLFRRWFLCMVANWQQRGTQYANCTSPLLTGKQGYRKSTFCKLLLPPALRFGFTDRLDIENKRAAELHLGRYLLINLDEFDQISARQQAFLKHLLQKASPSVRKPYSAVFTTMRRYASFIGTSNTGQLLYDTTGSRRFLCIEVKEKIDFPNDLDYKQLYAEALHALDNGERHWFNEEEEALLQTYNRQFEVENKYAQLFWSCYRRPAHTQEGSYLSCTEILRSICRPGEFSRISGGHIAMFGKQLQKWGLEKRHEEAGNCYKVVKL